MTKDEAMKLALEEMKIGNYNSAAERLEAALAQPQQEPVAIVAVDGIGQIQVGWLKKPQHNDKLYTSPPAQRKPLTPDLEADTGYSRDERAAFTAGWEAAEATHGIKGDA